MSKPLTRFATTEEIMTPEFMRLICTLDKIASDYQLEDFSRLNQARYPWVDGLLSTPSFYASRMWEYPFAILSAELQPGMRCADVGCGMSPFTIYLKDVAKCKVAGVDPIKGKVDYRKFGVSHKFIEQTKLEIIEGKAEKIPAPSNSFDRVFCLSVIEHLPLSNAKKGMQEIARILKPGGRAIITVDVNMHSVISRPLDLIWDSGLSPLGEVDLRWPFLRFGIFNDGKQPADVFGMTLIKDSLPIEMTYTEVKGSMPMIESYLVPTLNKKNLLITNWHHRFSFLYDRLPDRLFRSNAPKIK